ncbi:MAG: glutamine--fructose-6-phosphate transaminase (isomerizing) [Alphaproteobacteria bacterium]
MCGIIGIVGKQDVVPRLVAGLKSLEYRGYDSAGIAVSAAGSLQVRRAEGKIVALEHVLDAKPIQGFLGIGHTRWATHGAPSERNAHPHATEEVAIVHNGIIENYQELKSELIQKGFVFHSETDSEVISQLVTFYLQEGLSPHEAASKAFTRFHGAFAVAILFKNHDNLMICGRKGSPLVIGVGEGEMYVGSDALALSALTQRLVYLEEGDWAILHKDKYVVYDSHNKAVDRPETLSSLQQGDGKKGEYPHYMLKEIHEQPSVLRRLLEAYLNKEEQTLQFPFEMEWNTIPAFTIVACGTSYYAGLVAQNWMERWAGVPVRVEVASEFRYRQPPLPQNGVVIAISQSGETADTLAAVRYAKQKEQKILSLVNVPQSSIARESDYILPLMAGPEIGVASTKAFMAQLFVLLCVSLRVAFEKKEMALGDYKDLLTEMNRLPVVIEKLLLEAETLNPAAQFLTGKKSIIYLGRGSHYPIAMEGALKLKELSYLHAEGAPSGELKHGPIALIDEHTPIVFLLPPDELQEKNQSNLEEVIARKGKVLLFGNASCVTTFRKKVYDGFEMPEMAPVFLPLVYTIPVQLLAYKTAVLEGNDVDQPRNLAKSVTVE